MITGTDSAYNNALQKKQRLERQRQEIDAQLAKVEEFLLAYAEFEKATTEPKPTPLAPSERKNVAGTKLATPRQPQKAGISQESFEEIAVEVLTETGRPMNRGELRDAFRSRRIYIGGADAEKNFGTKLWKAANLEGGKLTYKKGVGYTVA